MSKYRIAGIIKECTYTLSGKKKYDFKFIPDSEFVSTFNDGKEIFTYAVFQPIDMLTVGLSINYDKSISFHLEIMIAVGSHLILELEEESDKNKADIKFGAPINKYFKISKFTMR